MLTGVALDCIRRNLGLGKNEACIFHGNALEENTVLVIEHYRRIVRIVVVILAVGRKVFQSRHGAEVGGSTVDAVGRRKACQRLASTDWILLLILDDVVLVDVMSSGSEKSASE